MIWEIVLFFGCVDLFVEVLIGLGCELIVVDVM